MRVVATRIEPDGTMQRRMVDTARQGERGLWEISPLARPVSPCRTAQSPASPSTTSGVDDHVAMAAEHDLAGPLLDLVTAVMALRPET